MSDKPRELNDIRLQSPYKWCRMDCMPNAVSDSINNKIKAYDQLKAKLDIAVEALEKYAKQPTVNHVVVTGPGEYHNAAEYALKKVNEMEKA